MRLLIVTDAWKPQVNGVARTYEWLVSALADRIDVDLLTPEAFLRFPLPTYPEIELALASPRSVSAYIRAYSPDAVHIATEGPLGFLARRYCLKAKIQFTTCYHTRFPEYIARRFPIPPNWTYAVLRRFHGAADRTLVATSELADELRSHGFENVVSWRRGIDVATFSDGPIEPLGLPRPVFLYVGRLAIEKNLDGFLSLDLPGSKLVVGSGPDRERLQRAWPDAHFYGPVRGEQLAAIYRAADVFVFPSLTDTYGLVMAEALAAGLPVACFPGAGARYIFSGEACGVMQDDLRVAALNALSIPRDLCRAVGARHSLQASADDFLRLVTSSVS